MHYTDPSDFEHLVLKEFSEKISVETGEECRLAALSMARQARRGIDIVSRSLDPNVFDNTEFCDAVTNMITGSQRAQFRALVMNTEPLVKQGHRLVTLAQRLSSFAEVRVPAKEYADYNSAFMIVDETGVLYRTLSDRYEGVVNFNDPRTARDLARQFDAMWQTATTDVNLKRSYL